MSAGLNAVSLVGQNPLILEKKEGELLKYLKEVKCKDAPDDEIKSFISYCQAAGLDPTADAAYLVGYFSKKLKKNIWTIIPGIGKFRIQASRSGVCMGIDNPEYGPILEKKRKQKNSDGEWVEKEIKYPEFCRVTVKKLISGKFSDHIASYVGEARWSDFEKFRQYNPIWFESPFNQLAKCAEAQALRKAFPELFGGQYTFEEVQDRLIRDDDQYQNADRSPNVVERLKNQRNIQVEKKEMGSLGMVEIIDIEGEEIPESQIEKPVKEVDGSLFYLFKLMMDAKPAITERVNEFMLKKGFNIGDLNNDNLKTLIKKIVSVFPEVKLQLSQEQKDIVEKIAKE